MPEISAEERARLLGPLFAGLNSMPVSDVAAFADKAKEIVFHGADPRPAMFRRLDASADANERQAIIRSLAAVMNDAARDECMRRLVEGPAHEVGVLTQVLQVALGRQADALFPVIWPRLGDAQRVFVLWGFMNTPAFQHEPRRSELRRLAAELVAPNPEPALVLEHMHQSAAWQLFPFLPGAPKSGIDHELEVARHQLWERACNCRDSLASWGCAADYTVEGVIAVNEFLGRALPSLGADDRDQLADLVAAYLGEVLRAYLGASWEVVDGQLAMVLQGPKGRLVINPNEPAAGRILDDNPNAIIEFFTGVLNANKQMRA